jgi:hypothetical protein
VQIEMRENETRITGNWRMGNGRGPFTFRIPMADMNAEAFQGEWRYNNQNAIRPWNGIRKPRE